ncbi:hypothetical protein H1Q63_02875 [Desmonostoc muscorum CCALA 125]|nr:hypothetical protein [Desmonostoc muscorum CCALA 125]
MKITLPKRLTKKEKEELKYYMENEWTVSVTDFPKDSLVSYVETENYLAIVLKIECDCREKFLAASPSYGHFIECPYCGKLHDITQEVYEKNEIPELYIS